MLTPYSGDYEDLFVGDRWVSELHVSDDDGGNASGLLSITALVNGEAATVEELGYGFYRVAVTITEPGEHLLVVSATGYGTTVFRAYAQDLSTALDNVPDLADVKTYLGNQSKSDAALQDALDAEKAAQRAVCRIPAIYPADLRQALLRRVARNLDMRKIPTAISEGESSMVVPGNDPEVRRLEKPYRKLVQP